MASPRFHTKATVILIAMCYGMGLIVGFTLLDYLDIFWIVVFGVLIDLDHLPFGRLYKAFKKGGHQAVVESWKRQGWLDSDHLNIMHTWWALVVVVIFSFFVGGVWAFIAFVVHLLIDSGSLNNLDYPKCSPLPRDVLRSIGLRYYPKWALYHTKGIPI